MRIQPVSLEGLSGLIKDYRQIDDRAMQFFDYNPFVQNGFYQRLDELTNKTYERKKLTDVLLESNKGWGAPAATIDNINRLKQPNSVVVVGGQQAGLLTGPIYSIHKLISIIKLAKEQEEKLGVPVVPLFWVAGEDHDFEEINHISLPIAPHMKKYKILQRQTKKESVSHMELDQEEAVKWLENIFRNLEETSWTKPLLTKLTSLIEQSKTFVDFFSRVVFTLFEQEGIVLLDSGDPKVRELESEFFVEMIHKRPEIAEGVRSALNKVSSLGYSVALDAEVNDGHLFYHLNGERILLHVDEGGSWVGKNEECKFTEEELIRVAKEQPSLLSNNVVTRPLMQEKLLPVLAFIGGPGEIAYWSVLKPAFEVLNVKMPPVVPRLSYTIVEPKTEKVLRQLAVRIEHVIQNGSAVDKLSWLKGRTTPPVEELSDQVKLTIEKAHKPLRDIAKGLQADLGQMAEKNLLNILNELDYLEQRISYTIKEKNFQTIQKFDWIEATLKPDGGLQERMWNVVYWLNLYGENWLKELIVQEIDWEADHFCVYI
ncbi:bacillithiol biosynthesis cysteine-adding enzyme BshC [Salirhabdus euzebyi]|uniref:Putative cysteine ligase BshC n=1 Tax=Salirhabdus euzebyi TaxID=394506 RepID=A0A841Q9D7_9BACI|nr:bacillithiol biosynthesis cysteine-adding enzyme BshC [Salirhabdus euzebyi]MBB6455020.1 bacillithiol biosynthesis cysteine-adding enzyme BshC [Salirhabdus euzebyi]